MTNEQERKVLEQIKKLIESTGEGSYISMAFDGCVEDAEDNITNDFGNSWKDRAQHYAKLQDDAIRENIQLTQKLNNLQILHDERGERIEKLKEELRSEKALANDAIGNYHHAADDLTATRAALEAAQSEIIKLKAMLFDYMIKESA